MLKVKLQALEYPGAENVNINNEKEYRSIILWLEDQKIRHYKIEDREPLRKLDSDKWPQAFAKYKSDIQCPITSGEPTHELDWILAFAVRLEYADNKEKYRTAAQEENTKTGTPNITHTNPLDNIDFHSQEFKNGINNLAQILKIPPHPDHLMVMRAIRKVICKRLSPEALQNPDSVIIKGAPFPFEDTRLGYELGDTVTNRAAKILCLLYIHQMRQLQTSINEMIVSIQNLTANPKTDTKLGKVGK